MEAEAAAADVCPCVRVGGDGGYGVYTGKCLSTKYIRPTVMVGRMYFAENLFGASVDIFNVRNGGTGL